MTCSQSQFSAAHIANLSAVLCKLSQDKDVLVRCDSAVASVINTAYVAHSVITMWSCQTCNLLLMSCPKRDYVVGTSIYIFDLHCNTVSLYL